MPGPTTMKLMRLQMGTPEEKAEVERELEEARQGEKGHSKKKKGEAGEPRTPQQR